MAIQILLHLAAFASGWSRISLYTSTTAGHGITQAEKQAMINQSVLIVTLQSCVIFPALTVFFMWVYRVCHNLPALGARGLTRSPHWAVGGFFVPIINLHHPYQVLSEVWKASEPRPLSSGPWQEVRPSLLVRLWWGGCLSTIVLFLVWLINGPSKNRSLNDVLTNITFEISLECLGAIVLGLGIVMIYEINERQEKKHALLVAEGAMERERET